MHWCERGEGGVGLLCQALQCFAADQLTGCAPPLAPITGRQSHTILSEQRLKNIFPHHPHLPTHTHTSPEAWIYLFPLLAGDSRQARDVSVLGTVGDSGHWLWGELQKLHRAATQYGFLLHHRTAWPFSHRQKTFCNFWWSMGKP